MTLKLYNNDEKNVQRACSPIW